MERVLGGDAKARELPSADDLWGGFVVIELRDLWFSGERGKERLGRLSTSLIRPVSSLGLTGFLNREISVTSAGEPIIRFTALGLTPIGTVGSRWLRLSTHEHDSSSVRRLRTNRVDYLRNEPQRPRDDAQMSEDALPAWSPHDQAADHAYRGIPVQFGGPLGLRAGESDARIAPEPIDTRKKKQSRAGNEDTLGVMQCPTLLAFSSHLCSAAMDSA
jgi:hypothetical protein